MSLTSTRKGAIRAATVVAGLLALAAHAADTPKAAPAKKAPVLTKEELRVCMATKDRLAQQRDEVTQMQADLETEAGRNAVLQAFGSNGNRTAIMSLMGGTQVVDLRREGINQLGNAQAGPELWEMYQKEQDKQLKMQILSALGNMGAYDKVIEVAKSEKDDEIRRRAIRSLGNMRSDRSGASLSEIYGSLTNVDDKKAVISGLANQNNAEGMIAIYRKESNFEIKKQIVSSLGNMPKNEAAKAFLLEILK